MSKCSPETRGPKINILHDFGCEFAVPKIIITYNILLRCVLYNDTRAKGNQIKAFFQSAE